MSNVRRSARFREDLHREVSALLEFESRDPSIRDAFPTVMDVQLSVDGRYAKVYVALEAEADREAVLAALKREQGYYRSLLADRIDVRHTPELRFVLDETLDRALRLEAILREEAADRTDEEPSG